MVTFLTIDGFTVALVASHVESLLTTPGSPELTIVTMASGAQHTLKAGSREVVARLASVLRGE